MKLSKEYISLILIVLLGFFLRLFLMFAIGYRDMASDALGYVMIAKALFQDGFLIEQALFFPPGYPLFIGVFNWFIADALVAARVVSVVFGTLTIFISYKIGKKMSNVSGGLFAALAMAIYPGIIQAGALAMSEALFIFFMFLAVYSSIKVLREINWFYIVVLGASIAFTYLIRPEGIFLFLLPCFVIFWHCKNFMFKNASKVLIVFLVFIILTTPYFYYVFLETGDFSISGKGGWNLLKGEIVTGPEEEWRIEYLSLNEDKTLTLLEELSFEISTIDYILENPGDMFERYVIQFIEVVRLLFYLIVPVLLALIIFFLNKYKDVGLMYMLLAYVAMLIFIYPLYTIHPRYLFILAAPLVLVSSLGFAMARKTVKKYYNKDYFVRNVKSFLVIILILFSCLYLVSLALDLPYYVSYGQGDVPEVYSDAADVIISYGETERLNVMAATSYISFFTDSNMVNFPYANVDDFLEYAGNREVDYIVIEESSQGNWDVYEDYTNLDDYDYIELIFEDDSTGALIQVFKID
ncbi:MAG: glycosyltransferase family 39 protein [Nanoarchaeota archaeon]|nr:glycosyltransferase family 39 protein [Nanoarchaeota archaeon]